MLPSVRKGFVGGHRLLKAVGGGFIYKGLIHLFIILVKYSGGDPEQKMADIGYAPYGNLDLDFLPLPFVLSVLMLTLYFEFLLLLDPILI